MTQEEFLSFLVQYAYQPFFVYSAVIGMLAASSFGLPIPEEITLVSAGLLAFLAQNPENFPPPYPGAMPIQPIPLAFTCLLAVLISDTLVFYIGRYGGRRFKNSERLKKYSTSETMKKVELWTKKYGAVMAGVFRFTPGLRFPGHMACGMFGVSTWKFFLVDGTAAILTVPTQVVLVAYYGEHILKYFMQIKYVVFALCAVALIAYIFKRTKVIQRIFGSKTA